MSVDFIDLEAQADEEWERAAGRNAEINRFLHNGKRVQIFVDEDPMNPWTEFDHSGTLVLWGREFGHLSDRKDISRNDFDESDKMPVKRILKEEWGINAAILLPVVWMGQHGIAVSDREFDPDDHGHIGFVFLTREEILDTWGGKILTAKRKTNAIAYLKAVVDEYGQYLDGEVYGYVITDHDEEEVDSCWGFIGYNYAIEEAKAAANGER